MRKHLGIAILCGAVLFGTPSRGHAQETTLDDFEGAGAPEVIASFLRQHYSAATMLPPEIVTPATLPDAASLEVFLTERRGGPARLHVPQRGKKRHLAEKLFP